MTWRHLDLFSGIGGFSLAAQWVWGDELEIVAFCEIDKFCQKVLRKHWPDVPIIEDVRDVTLETFSNSDRIRLQIYGNGESLQQQGTSSVSHSGNARIDLLTGGFPCQPFSCAGKRKGKEDNRFLWPEMLRVIQETRPRWIIAENVAGIVRMALDDCLSDLEGEGYSTQAIIIPACAVNAPHRRDRVWIVAHTGEPWTEISTFRSSSEIFNSRCSQDVADTENPNRRRTGRENDTGRGNTEVGRCSIPGSRLSDWSTEPDVGRVAHGISNRVDRLKSLGNAIVPQVAYQIMKAIKELEKCKS